jgi:RNA polymerase sigma factor (sigma-70 family)
MHQGRQASDQHPEEHGFCGGHRDTLAQSSAELVDRIRAGDDSGWRDLIDQYEPMLRSIARRRGLSAEEAADAVQLTWLRCLEHIDQLTHPDRLRGWLATICRRECIQLITRNRREVPLTEQDAARLTGDREWECDPCAEVARRDEHDRLHRAITALPDRERTILSELLKPERHSYLDVSDRLGLPLGSIGPTWHRAVIRLRRDPRLAGPPPAESRPQLRGGQSDIAVSHKALVRA